MSGFRTDLSRARGHGPARHGAGHWLSERISAVALAPLSLWAVYAALQLTAAPYGVVVGWVQDPVNAVLLVLLIAISFWHMHSGMRVIVEDYIHTTFSKSVLLLLNLFVSVLAGALAVFAILKVAFSGGVI